MVERMNWMIIVLCSCPTSEMVERRITGVEGGKIDVQRGEIEDFIGERRLESERVNESFRVRDRESWRD